MEKWVKLVELVRKIERALHEYAPGCRNTDALGAILQIMREIQYRTDVMAGYNGGDPGQAVLFDPGYVREKLVSLKGEVDRLYSPRKHLRSGGVDVVKRQAMSDCYRLRNYFGWRWRQTSDEHHLACASLTTAAYRADPDGRASHRFEKREGWGRAATVRKVAG